MIQAEHLSFSYGDLTVLDDLSFCVDDFSTLALLGQNGEGKTTLLKLLLGLLKPQSGSIQIDGRDPSRLTERELSRFLSYVPQECDDSLNMSVSDFICMGRISEQGFLRGPKEHDRKEAASILKQLSLEQLSARSLKELSSGQRRLIYLIRAIYQKSSYILMDEPVNSLDLKRQHDFLYWLKDITKVKDRRIIMSIHDPALAYTYADAFLFMKSHQAVSVLSKKDPDFKKEFLRRVEELYEHSVKAEFYNEQLLLYYLKP